MSEMESVATPSTLTGTAVDAEETTGQSTAEVGREEDHTERRAAGTTAL